MKKSLITISLLCLFLSFALAQSENPQVVNAGAGNLQSENMSLTYFIGDYIGYHNFSESEYEIELEEITVYPTPVRTTLYLQTSIPDLEKIRIFDLQGVMIRELMPSSNEVDFSEFPGGIYIMKFMDNNDEQIGFAKVLKN